MRPAAFTIVRNEPVFLRTWCNYYCDSFPQEDVYILDNSTIDGSVSEAKELHPRINVINVPSPKAFDHLWLKRTVEAYQRRLLATHNVVLFAEADEFLIPDLDRHDNIYDYCTSFAARSDVPTSLRAKGWAVIHQVDDEPAIDLSSGRPLLADRGLMWPLPDYNKTLITKVPLVYSKGFHITYNASNEKEGSRPIEPDLSLMHAWHIDMDLYHQRHVARKKVGSMQAFHGSDDLEQVKELFRTRIEPWNRDRLSPLYVGGSAPVPTSWKTLLRY